MTRLVSMLAAALACLVFLPTAARADFGIDDFDLTFTDQDGSPATQAGSHPFAMTISLPANLDGEEPDGKLRDLFLEGPPGLVGNTTAYPRCTRAAFLEIEEGVNNCPLGSAVGISTSSFDEPGKSIDAPVFNLAPSPGALASLGFRVASAASLVVDIGLSPYPPHSPIAAVRDVPDGIDLFGVELQLWGDPASTDHDAQRGICGTTAAGDLCPVSLQERPLLTLPTRCNGPLASFYEALSWEGDEDFGASLTHDGLGNPQGLTGCGKLAFTPSMKVQATTEAAKTPTGLDFSLDVVDEGLASASGVAHSQIRHALLALPPGMAAAPTLGSGSGGCSEADLEDESLLGSPDDGCPESSKVGTIEVESPLVAEPVGGAVYRAVPFQNFAGDSPMALYFVLEDPDLGIAVTQVAGVEPDPESGQLIIFAPELPQLPFSHLQLHLQEGDGAPLISPPLCGDYQVEAEIVPWSSSDVYVLTSGLGVVSGPSGGPCPTGEGSQPPKDPSSPLSSGQAPAPFGRSSPRGANGKRRCPKAKRRVRRNGKIRCVKKGRHRPAGHRHRAGHDRVR
ncbi:MAG TPA: hypothetical protein VFM94_01935 [Solirubrobacterales bacterium]|nr:hypothetical protein [Solirubrobacterales bacterium]